MKFLQLFIVLVLIGFETNQLLLQLEQSGYTILKRAKYLLRSLFKLKSFEKNRTQNDLKSASLSRRFSGFRELKNVVSLVWTEFKATGVQILCWYFHYNPSWRIDKAWTNPDFGKNLRNKNQYLLFADKFIGAMWINLCFVLISGMFHVGEAFSCNFLYKLEKYFMFKKESENESQKMQKT